MNIVSTTEIALAGGRTLLSRTAAAYCRGPVVAVYVWDPEDEDCDRRCVGTFRHGLPPEATAIERAALVALVGKELGRFEDDDLGMTQDCYGQGAPVSPYGAARTAIAAYAQVRRN